MMQLDYLFIDPFNSCKSGVTHYTLLCYSYLINNGKKVYILKKDEFEPLEEFCKRVALFVDQNEIYEIEAPETLACTRYVQHENIHIRLHLSRQVGRYLQGFNIDAEAVVLEQREIDKAAYLSAPSCIALEISKKIFIINDCHIYPNPINMPLIYENYSKINFDVLGDGVKQKIYFIARGENLKGIVFLSIFKFFENSLICIGDEKLELFLKKNNLSIPFFSGEDKAHLAMPKYNDIVIVPSLFETWSMVGVEGLTNFARVITWDHLGFCEFFDNKLLKKVKFPDSKSFILGVQDVLNKPFEKIDSVEALKEMEDVYCQFTLGIERREIKRERDLHSDPNLVENIQRISKRTKKKQLKALLYKLFKNPQLFWRDSKLSHRWKKLIK